MGTSTSHGSPATLNWRAVAATYTVDNISIERTVEEVWKAVILQPNSHLVSDLGSKIVIQCLQIALEVKTPEEANAQTSEAIAISGKSSIAADIARRAAVQALLSPRNRTENFIRSLFTQTIDYLVSRDLSGYIGQSERIRNISGSIELKRSIKEEVKIIVDKVPRPEKVERDPIVWGKYINNLALRLAGLNK